MCIIIVSANKPELSVLEAAERQNRDGGGIAWRENGKVRFMKGLTAKQIFEITQTKEPPFISHFRIGTIGPKTNEFTHPFPIGGGLELEGETDGVLFHNGHWRDWDDKLFMSLNQYGKHFPEGEWSDSRAMAYLSKLWGVNWLQLISANQKIAVLTSDSHQFFGEWEKHDENTWVSHKLYTGWIVTTVPKAATTYSSKYEKRAVRSYKKFQQRTEAGAPTNTYSSYKDADEYDTYDDYIATQNYLQTMGYDDLEEDYIIDDEKVKTVVTSKTESEVSSEPCSTKITS